MSQIPTHLEVIVKFKVGEMTSYVRLDHEVEKVVFGGGRVFWMPVVRVSAEAVDIERGSGYNHNLGRLVGDEHDYIQRWYQLSYHEVMNVLALGVWDGECEAAAPF